MSGSLKIHFLGTGSIVPNPDRSCSSILLQTPRENILIDIGSGTLRRMAEQGIDPTGITYIFITHFHPDHTGDLVPFLFQLRNLPLPEDHSLRVWGPRGFLSFVRHLQDAFGRWVQTPTENTRFYELKRRLLDFPGFRLIWGKVIHKNESVGFRFEINGKIITFSGDSGYCPELIRLSRDADIAVLECSHADEYAVEGHLTPSLAAKIASDGGVKKLILTHFYPDALQSDILSVAQKYFPGDIVLAHDGLDVELPLE